jgi:mannitol-1-/sugar-/sorbitol-6-phosphatase
MVRNTEQASEDAVVRWMPGAQEFLAGLTDLHWAVVTSGTRRPATASMRKAGMPTPSVLVTADGVGVARRWSGRHLPRGSPSQMQPWS